ncbi:hypothetical protein AUJ14_04020 [Candidatus Micrarchaeota archaeon CG1_02_55_22]|nr:MAG: hypothetical protein AUJ14_04020 [Candidatus Micrarchaeota archaeon CG1_02_55_22]
MKKILSGTGASPGTASGTVRLVKDANDTPRFRPGEILVTHLTNPSMIMMMARAAGIITDVGGVTSHPAIVSREFGIPCVVATRRATEILSDGMQVKIDGTTGEVFLVDNNGNTELD